MGAIWKKMLIIASILLLSVYTSMVDLVDKDNIQKPFIERITTAGWVFVGLSIGLIVLNLYVDGQNDKEANENKQRLKDIQFALDKAGIKYDDALKKIVNISSNNARGLVNIQGTTVSDVKISNVGDKRSEQIPPYKPSKMGTAIDENDFITKVNEAENKKTVKDRLVYLYTVNNTKGQEYFLPIIQMLAAANYKVASTGVLISKDHNMPKIIIIDYNDEKTSIIINDV